jgi:predicted nucleotidyltransferase
VQCLLHAYLPANSKVWVFGSRANGTVKRASDLDLAVDAGERLALGIPGVLADSFTVAPLACKVDLIDLHSITPEFRALIDAHKIALPGFE